MPKPHHFVRAPLGSLIKAARALGSTPLLVWLYLEYQRALTHRRTIEVTNVEMAKWCVSRKQKHRALRLLEEAGLIRVERVGRRSPRVSFNSD